MSLSRGSSMLTFLRLCSRAPRITRSPERAGLGTGPGYRVRAPHERLYGAPGRPRPVEDCDLAAPTTAAGRRVSPALRVDLALAALLLALTAPIIQPLGFQQASRMALT